MPVIRSSRPRVARQAVAPAPFAARPPLVRDPWLAAVLLAFALLVVRTLGVPFGEPVADDFDHLHQVLFSHDGSWWGGGGSASFWRPLAYQGYYGLLHDVILSHPVWIGVLHTALLLVSVLLLYDLVRDRLSGPAAAFAAATPLALEATRALLIVPVHIVDLGLVFASVVAWWCAARGRLVPALLAVLAALLCKETAIVTALMLPAIARPDARRPRRVWLIATGALAVLWAVAYVTLRRQLAMALPHGLEAGLSPSMLLDPARYLWAVAGSLRALVSLPMKPEALEGPVLAITFLMLGGAVVRLAFDATARARFARSRGLALLGLAWFVLATGTLLPVYPVWSPERIVYSSLGLGVALAVVLAAAHPALLGAFAALRLVLLCLAPGAPDHVTREVADRGAFVDFERLARLQLLMREARTTLAHEFPVLPTRARVALLHPPFLTDYAGGDRALQVWRRDSTLHWVRWDAMAADEAAGLAGAMEFREDSRPPFRRVDPLALRALFVAGRLNREQRFQAAYDTLQQAEALQRDREALHFAGRVAGLESWCLGMLGRVPEAELRARQSLAIAPENADGHLAMAAILNGRGDYSASLAHLDTLLTWYPNFPPATMMRAEVFERLRSAPPGTPGRAR